MKRQFWILLFVSLILGTGWQVDNGRLLITEIYYDTPGDDSLEEWIEIANVGTAVVDLSKIKIGDEDQPGGPEGMNRFPEGALIEPGQVIIVAQSAADFHNLFGVNPDYELSDSDPNVPDMRRYRLWSSGDIGLNNDGDELLLLDANNQLLDSLNYGDSTTYFAPSIQNVLRGQSLARLPADCNTGTAADWQPLEFPTPGEISLEGECTASLNPVELETLLPIGAVQGAAD
ncbi:MAG: lamin tail domain-containing protein, partial [Chloroflexi bacterium]|nr:lamin tail domain-containing protein [Chloroflexota bacterium]